MLSNYFVKRRCRKESTFILCEELNNMRLFNLRRKVYLQIICFFEEWRDQIHESHVNPKIELEWE